MKIYVIAKKNNLNIFHCDFFIAKTTQQKLIYYAEKFIFHMCMYRTREFIHLNCLFSNAINIMVLKFLLCNNFFITFRKREKKEKENSLLNISIKHVSALYP